MANRIHRAVYHGNFPTASLPDAAICKAGDLCYDTTTNKLQVFNGTAWEAVTST